MVRILDSSFVASNHIEVLKCLFHAKRHDNIRTTFNPQTCASHDLNVRKRHSGAGKSSCSQPGVSAIIFTTSMLPTGDSHKFSNATPQLQPARLKRIWRKALQPGGLALIFGIAGHRGMILIHK